MSPFQGLIQNRIIKTFANDVRYQKDFVLRSEASLTSSALGFSHSHRMHIRHNLLLDSRMCTWYERIAMPFYRTRPCEKHEDSQQAQVMVVKSGDCDIQQHT